MKKLLVLTLVLGIASLAPATLQISVNGNPDPVDSEIVIAPSDELILDVHTDVTLEYTGTYLLMVVDKAQGTLSGGAPTQGGVSSELNYYAPYFAYYAGLDSEALSAVAGNVSDTGTGVTFEGQIYDQILFHCEKEGDAIVQLYASADGAVWEYQDAVIIHQIPEPATMALLGLGALVLRRKK
jgi:hypothetical protein